MANWTIEHQDHAFSAIHIINPEKLHFTKRIRDAGDIDYEISLTAEDTDGNPAIFEHDFIGPYRTHFKLMRDRASIMDGLHTSVGGSYGADHMKVAGKDWMHYLQRRRIPFDPQSTDYLADGYVFGPNAATCPAGLSYQESNRPASSIIKDILDLVLAKTYSLPIAYVPPSDSSLIIDHLALSLGDTSTVHSIISGLSEYYPGFDFWIGNGRVFHIAEPYRYGDPATLVESGGSDPNIIWKFTDAYENIRPIGNYLKFEPQALDFTNTGPQATNLFGVGAGTANQVGSVLGSVLEESTFWRLDGDINYGDQALTQTTVIDRTQIDFIYGVQPVHEIPLTIDPQVIPDFWTLFDVGLAVWIDIDLGWHHINSPHRIISMDCTITDQGDEIVQLGLNQIYDPAGDFGIEEG